MPADVFLDTNVLVYAFFPTDHRSRAAERLLHKLAVGEVPGRLSYRNYFS
jgi:predicted nucleic acid-binding protein